VSRQLGQVRQNLPEFLVRPPGQARQSPGGRAEVRLGHRLRDGLRRAADHREREGGVAVKAAIYARVSSSNGSQTCENQLLELRRYCEARGSAVHAEYTDEMSGAKDRRPGLDRLPARAQGKRLGRPSEQVPLGKLESVRASRCVWARSNLAQPGPRSNAGAHWSDKTPPPRSDCASEIPQNPATLTEWRGRNIRSFVRTSGFAQCMIAPGAM
jgi:hypothetical protein